MKCRVFIMEVVTSMETMVRLRVLIPCKSVGWDAAIHLFNIRIAIFSLYTHGELVFITVALFILLLLCYTINYVLWQRSAIIHPFFSTSEQ